MGKKLVSVRLDPAIVEKLEGKARSLGIGLSEFCRRTLTESVVVEEERKDMLQEIRDLIETQTKAVTEILKLLQSKRE